MKNLLILLAVLCPILLFSQTTDTISQVDLNQPDRIKIFLDCQGGCDQRYFRQSVGYADFMRDRQEASIFMQMIRQRSGNGGNQYSLQIQGQKEFEDIPQDTLTFFTNPEDSDSVVRDAMLQRIQKALLPYLIRTPWKDQIEFSIPNSNNQEDVTEEDPWNAWVFRTGINGNINGESQFTSINLNGNFRISRVLESSKFFLSFWGSRQRSEFTLTDGTRSINRNNSTNAFLLYAKSLSDHWSLGGFASWDRSDFSNLDSRWSFKPAIEYSFVPYSENTVRQFNIMYRIGPVFNNYKETTILGVDRETLIQQNLDIEYQLIKDWGSVELELEFNNFVRDLKQSSISFSPGVEWNIFKGFSLDLFASITYIADRINIPEGTLTDEEILLGFRQLDSNFSYFTFFGISYRFGSQLNNVVNIRF